MPKSIKGAKVDNLLLSLIETSPAAIAVNDFDGNFLYINQRAVELHGYSQAELLGLNLRDINVPEIQPLIDKHLNELREHGTTIFEVQHLRKDGTILPLQVFSKKGTWEGKDVILSIATDITQQKLEEQAKNALILERDAEHVRIQTALNVTEEKYRSLVENIPDVLWTSDEQGNTLFISESVKRVYGYSPEEILGESNLWFERVHPEDIDRVKSAYAALINDNKLYDVEFRIQRKDRQWIWVHDRASKTYNIGQTRYVDGIFRDITEHKREEEELRLYRHHLEDLVKDRTRELESKNYILAEEINERKRAEEALRESEQTFRTLTESAPNMIFINQERKLAYVNPRCVELMGYSFDEFYDPQFNFMTLISPEHRDIIKKMFQQHAKGEEVAPMEYAILKKDGTRLEAIYGSRLIMYKGKPAILGVVTDITERKRAEEALRTSETQLKDAQALGKIGSWGFDLATQKISWSEQTFRLYGRDPTLGPPTPLEESEYYPTEQNRILREIGEMAIAKGKSFQYDLEARLKSGKSVFFSCVMQPIKDSQGRVVKLFGTVQDITDRRLIEERLRQTNQFLDTIIDNIPLIITVKETRTLTYVRVNRTFIEQSKMKETEIVGKAAEGLFTAEETKGITANDQQIIREKQIRQFEGRITRTGRIYRTTKIPISNASGEVVYLLSIADDITDQLEIEQERKEMLQKALLVSDYKSNLLSHTAHELKTPLTVIFGWSELFYNAKKQGKSLDTIFDVEDFEAILRNAERLNILIDDFLDVGRIEKGVLKITKQDLDFHDVVENSIRAINYFAMQKHIALSKQVTPTGRISVDRRRIEQVLINLLSNAIKYSPENTVVIIKTGPVEVEGRAMLRLEIIDQGFGFTPQELAEAMTPFGKINAQQEQKRSIQGTGLGLFISRQIIEQHGGSLVIRSDGINKGTKVEVLLPLG